MKTVFPRPWRLQLYRDGQPWPTQYGVSLYAAGASHHVIDADGGLVAHVPAHKQTSWRGEPHLEECLRVARLVAASSALEAALLNLRKAVLTPSEADIGAALYIAEQALKKASGE